MKISLLSLAVTLVTAAMASSSFYPDANDSTDSIPVQKPDTVPELQKRQALCNFKSNLCCGMYGRDVVAAEALQATADLCKFCRLEGHVKCQQPVKERPCRPNDSRPKCQLPPPPCSPGEQRRECQPVNT